MAQALWITGPGRTELRTEEIGRPRADEVRVRARFGGISRGTESLVSCCYVPASEWQTMRAPFQSGDFPFPVKYGYASSGLVEEGPAELLGRIVFCLFPHQDEYIVPASAVVPVPENVPAERAVLAANMETALNIVWDAGIGPGDRVAIVGAGVVGSLAGFVAARIVSTEVTLVDKEPSRAAIAEAFGCAFATPDRAPSDCDVVIHASASAGGLATAIGAAGFEATIVEASWYGDRTVEAPLGGAFHSKRLRLVSSQVGAVATSRRARFTHRRRMETALSLLADPKLDRLISGETPFAELPVRYAGILADPQTLMHRVRYL